MEKSVSLSLCAASSSSGAAEEGREAETWGGGGPTFCESAAIPGSRDEGLERAAERSPTPSAVGRTVVVVVIVHGSRTGEPGHEVGGHVREIAQSLRKKAHITF